MTLLGEPSGIGLESYGDVTPREMTIHRQNPGYRLSHSYDMNLEASAEWSATRLESEAPGNGKGSIPLASAKIWRTAMNKKPWCPRNGCGRPNGAAREVKIVCQCGNEYGSFTKLCPLCKLCHSCKRVGKKFWKVSSLSRKQMVPERGWSSNLSPGDKFYVEQRWFDLLKLLNKLSVIDDKRIDKTLWNISDRIYRR